MAVVRKGDGNAGERVAAAVTVPETLKVSMVPMKFWFGLLAAMLVNVIEAGFQVE